nr:unnamed protein product [Callosobruchus analis]
MSQDHMDQLENNGITPEKIVGEEATDSIQQKSKVFNLQKPNQYSETVYVLIEKVNNENIGKLHPMTEFPPFPPMQNLRPNYSRHNQPSQASTSRSVNIAQSANQIQTQNTNPQKKRKTASLAVLTAPMSTFSFGREKPVYSPQSGESHEINEEFIKSFFNVFHKILSEVQSFEELSNIDPIKIKEIIPPLTLSSIYCPPNARTSTQDYISLIDDFDGSIIIGGDFNAHHVMWGSYKINASGSNIANLLNQTDLVILNDGSSTKISRTQRNSAVDLTLVSPDMVNKITWKVPPDTLGSDHFVISIGINSSSHQTLPMIFPKTKWDTRNVDWKIYQTLTETYFNNARTDFDNLKEKYNHFIAGIESVATASIPIKKPFQPKNRPPPPWWDSERDNIVSQRKQSLVNYLNQSTLESYIQV